MNRSVSNTAVSYPVRTAAPPQEVAKKVRHCHFLLMWNLFSLSSSSLNCCSCRCMSLKLLIDHPRKKCRSGADRADGMSKMLVGPTLYGGYNLSPPPHCSALIRIGLANMPKYGEDRSSRPHTFRRPRLSGAKTMPHGAISSVDVLFCNSKSRCIFMSKHL